MNLIFPRLKKTIVVKKISEVQVFAIDISNDEDKIYKFVGPSVLYLHSLINGYSQDKILLDMKGLYSDLNEEEVEKDLRNFISKLEEFQFIDSENP